MWRQTTAAPAMTATRLRPPHVGDVVHYWPLLPDVPGCRAALVTEIHVDPHLASLAILHASGVQFLLGVRQAELDPLVADPFTDKYEPGTWHEAKHR